MTYVAAIDVGGTSMKGGLIARDGTILHFERRPTPRAEGPDRVVAAVARFAADLTRPWDPARPPTPVPLEPVAGRAVPRLPAEGPAGGAPPAVPGPVAGERPAAVGVAVPGLVSRTHAVFSAAFGWRDVPAAAFADVDLPVALGHDVRSAGEAELTYGDGEENALYLPIGTGIAGAVVASGELYAGTAGWAGQIGHIPVRPDGLACGCGQRGCLAAYASGSAVAARCGMPGAEDVVRLAAQGDARAAAVWGEAVEALALALATYTLVADPAAVVIGGGVSLAGDALVAPLRERLAARLAFRPAPAVRVSRLGPLAGLLGAGLLGRRAAGAA